VAAEGFSTNTADKNAMGQDAYRHCCFKAGNQSVASPARLRTPRDKRDDEIMVRQKARRTMISRFWFSHQRKETAMKFTTIALATAFALSGMSAFAQGGPNGTASGATSLSGTGPSTSGGDSAGAAGSTAGGNFNSPGGGNAMGRVSAGYGGPNGTAGGPTSLSGTGPSTSGGDSAGAVRR